MTTRLRIVPKPSAAIPLHDHRVGLHFNNALDGAPLACVQLDTRGVVQAANPAACQLLKLAPHRPGSAVLSAYISPPDMAAFFQYVREVHASSDSRRRTLKMRRRDGLPRWLRLEGRRTQEGPESQILVSLVDVSEIEEADQRLRDSEARMRTLLESLPDAVFVLRDGRVAECNPAGRALTGRDPVGVAFAELLSAEQHSLLEARGAPATSSCAPERHELRFQLPGGQIRTAETLWLPVSFAGSSAQLCVARDQTDQRQLEAKVANNDRLATVGVLAAGVAHELNNPLTYVMMNLREVIDGLEDRTPADPRELKVSAGEALDGAKRMARIVGDLHSLARVDDELGPVDINAIAERSLTLTSAHARSRAEVRVKLGNVVPVWGDAGRLTQVILNLILNALQALPPSAGCVTVSTAMTRDRVTVSVRDNGPGIARKVRERLFEPFVTTKEAGQGTGLGLYVCHRYVTECSGYIEVLSPPGGGAQFDVHLRKCPGAVERAEEVEKTVNAAFPARILIVDDEPVIRGLLARRLSSLGEVIIADNADDALELIHSGTKVDAILCDLLMPGKGGRELYERLASERPEMLSRLGFMTGGAVDTGDRMFLETLEPPLLRKPFSKEELIEFVSRRLSESAVARTSHYAGSA